ncbi:MAG: adenylate kinase [Candidatus Binatia bacterium]
MRVVFLGPPGAGKGTQALFLKEKYGVCPVSTGELLRKAVRDRTSLGKGAARHIEKGRLVPDKVMLSLVAERLRKNDCKRGFVLDGFPRTRVQADGLDAILKEMECELDCVFYIRVPQSVILERLVGRRTCKRCGSLYHIVFDPPGRTDFCDRCLGELYQREDDREEAISARLHVYETQTAPLIDYYRKRDLLKEIDGVGSVEEIRDRFLKALGGA